MTSDLPVREMARVCPLKLAQERLRNNLIRIVTILSSQKKEKVKYNTFRVTKLHISVLFFNSSNTANLPKQRNVKFH